MRATQMLRIHRKRLISERARLDAIMNRFAELQDGGMISGSELITLCDSWQSNRRAVVAAIAGATDMINAIGSRD